MIVSTHLDKYYGDFRSLHDITLTIGEGSVVGLIGSNGSGKSTFLRVVSGDFRPDGGEITCDGAPIFENIPEKRKIVYLSDEQFFLPHGTIADMRDLYASMYPSFNMEKYKAYLDVFELDDTRRINTFSKGMMKQASILLGLACRPKYLLCDETFDGLDPVMRKLFRSILAEEMTDSGMTAVIASHNLRDLEDICDHVALLHKSELVFERELDEVKRSIHKIQVAFNDAAVELPASLDVISAEWRGHLCTMTVRGVEDEIRAALEEKMPVFCEFLTPTLEEVFLAEMEDKGYDTSKFLD